MKNLLFVFVILLSAPRAMALDDPTEGKPFFPWLWYDQFKPTLKKSVGTSELSILGGTVAATIAAHQYDPQVEDTYGGNARIPTDVTKYGSMLGSGGPGISVAVLQLLFDQQNGLAHARALLFTSITAISVAEIAERDRPNHANHLSFPSGHTSSSFATATSLAYAYGPWVGVPCWALASFVAVTRVSDNDHWFSDTVAAAGLGIYWARASSLAAEDKNHPSSSTFLPVPIPGGGILAFTTEY